MKLLRATLHSTFALIYALAFIFEPTLHADKPYVEQLHSPGKAAQEVMLPSFSVQIGAPEDGKPPVIITVTLVPQTSEKKVLNGIADATRRAGAKAAPLYIIDDEQGGISKDFGKAHGADAKIKVVKIRGLDREPGTAYEPTCRADRMIASEQKVDKLGMLVTAGATGVFSAGFYVANNYSASTGLEGLALAGIIQAINNLFPNLLWNGMRNGGTAGAHLAQKIAPNSQAAASAGDTMGQVAVAYLKNLVETQSFFTVKQGLAPAMRGLLTEAGLANLLKTAASGMFANNMWDFAFNRWRQNNQVSEETIRYMNYIKTGILTVTGFLSFAPAPQVAAAARVANVVIGLIGLAAAFYGPSMIEGAKYLLDKMRNATTFKLEGNSLREQTQSAPFDPTTVPEAVH
jgi:hypothetical protein